MKCSNCDETISPAKLLKCAKCLTSFHNVCANVATENLKKMGKKKLNWKCGPCKADLKRKNEKSVTPIPSDSDSQSEDEEDEDPEMRDSRPVHSSDVAKGLRTLNRRFSNFEKSMEFFAAKIDDFTKSLESSAGIIKELKKANETLAQKNQWLEKKVSYLDKKVNEIEQKDYSNHVQITGIPETKGENVMYIIEQIANKANLLELKKENISEVFRSGPLHRQTRPRDIIVKFKTPEPKLHLVQWSRKCRGIPLSEIDGKLPKDSKAYINERLTNLNRYLLTLTKMFAREYGYKFTWIKDGKIYLRKNEESPAMKISAKGQLEKMDVSKKLNWDDRVYEDPITEV
ncbi:conserved hypothetical protein [Nesidiocoris tenuis]|uniref:PHD-type domain-containing protein n=1 Tax=Nesidiocoris tenuis TaxID=355587 RepID=A0ABN7B1V2_9HEMI|nr:conserved hypothetical protein [Nesidiocoris tenuis]